MRPTISSHHRRHMMLPAAGAEKVEIVFAILVLPEDGKQMPAKLGFRTQGRRQGELACHAMIGRDLLEQRLDRRGADGVEHLLFDGRNGVGHEGVSEGHDVSQAVKRTGRLCRT